jgi:DNA-directed RNA polymerase II subunit RPB3
MSFEYDPYNKFKRTTYWREVDERAEWPLSENAKEEEPPRENEAFDYSAIPKRFYFEVETVGSVNPQEVVLKVRVASERNACISEPKLIFIYRDLQSYQQPPPI